MLDIQRKFIKKKKQAHFFKNIIIIGHGFCALTHQVHKHI